MERDASRHAEKLEAILRAIPDIVFILDEDGRYGEILTSQNELLYKEYEKLRGRTLREMLPGDVAELAMDAVAKALATGDPVTVEYRLEVQVGERWFEGRASPIETPKGATRQVLWIASDITERKAAEKVLEDARDALEGKVADRTRELSEKNLVLERTMEELHAAQREIRASEARYRSLIEGSTDGVALIVDGILEYINPALATMLGYDPEDFIGTSFADFLPDTPGGRRILSHYADRLAGRPAPEQYEALLRAKDGAILDVIISGQVVNLDGRRAICGFVKDITERKRTEERLIHAERLAAVGTLAAGVAHEFNNIHTTIRGFLELTLEDPNLSPTARNMIERVHRSVLRAAGVTQSLLTLSRRGEARKLPADLNSIAEETVRLFQGQFEAEGITLSTRLEAVPDVWADPGQIGQVLMNLLINARHALVGRSDGRVSVVTGGEGERVFLRVADNGCGIPPEHISNLFLPFFTTKGEHAEEGSAQAHVRGSGLGLATCNTIVRNHGGSIDVASEPGMGAVFTVWLPVASPDLVDTESPLRPPPAECAGRILVVDDEEDVRGLLENALGRRGHEVTATDDGREALALHEESPFDLVLIDLQMPKMNGQHLLRTFLGRDAGTRPECIVITGKMTDTARMIREAHADTEFLEKPFDLAWLYERIQAALKRRQAD